VTADRVKAVIGHLIPSKAITSGFDKPSAIVMWPGRILMPERPGDEHGRQISNSPMRA
jgi:hypothetical protein